MKAFSLRFVAASALAIMAVAFLVDFAEAGIRSRGGCSTSGCSTSGCSTSSGCSVNNNSRPTRNDLGLTIVPFKNPPQVVKGADGMPGRDGKDGKDGLPGPKGDPGQITQEQVDQIVQSVSTQLLVQMKADPTFRGQDGKDAQVDVQAIVAQVRKEIPAVDLDDVAAKVVAKLPAPDLDAIAQKIIVRLPKIDTDKLAAEVAAKAQRSIRVRVEPVMLATDP